MKRKLDWKRWLLWILALVVGGYVLYQYNLAQGIDSRPQEYDFAVSDTSSIDKIVIWDKTPDTVVLERKEKIWIVNGQHRARKDAVEVLLETLFRVKLRNFPQASALPNILSGMSTYGREVQVFSRGEVIKHFFVGTETPDMLGTYMMIRGADQPYATYIPGFNGYLSSRFFVREDLWRDRTLFGIDNKSLRMAQIRYPDSAQANFRLTQASDGSYALYHVNLDGKKTVWIESAREESVRVYSAAFRNLSYEGMIIPSDGIFKKQDSLRATQPAFLLDVSSENQSFSLVAYHVKADPDAVGPDGLPLTFDPDRFYAFLSDGRFVLIQRHGFQQALVSLRSFY